MKIQADLAACGVRREILQQYTKAAAAASGRLWSGAEAFTGWVRLPLAYADAGSAQQAELDAILTAASEIREKCELLIVIGIGGSYLGARAVIEALAPADSKGCRVLFAGHNLSADYHQAILNELEHRQTCLCVISKSGTTTEPSIAFAVLKDALYRKYGKEEGRQRIYAITDREKGVLRKEADEEGYTTFLVPDDIGGRYSVLTPVGLLPIAAAGIDIRGLLTGAAAAAQAAAAWNSQVSAVQTGASEGTEASADPSAASVTIPQATPAAEATGSLFDYAIARYILGGFTGNSSADPKPTVDAAAYNADAAEKRHCRDQDLDNAPKQIEIFEYYEPRLQYFAEWLKQLFGESEGKDGKGLFPASLSFTADLHSMGQFLQQGHQLFFETVLDVQEASTDLTVPDSAGGLLAGRSMNEVNRAAVTGVIAAHRQAGIPIIRINIPSLTPHAFGQLIYFFESVCGITAYMMGVNPFDQPGVERYKTEMKAALASV